jgi:hypothetical protein
MDRVTPPYTKLESLRALFASIKSSALLESGNE